MHFVKWQALGNDFVFVNGFKEKLEEVTRHTKKSATVTSASALMVLYLFSLLIRPI